MPFKFNAAGRHRIPRARHRVTNWPAYDVGLRGLDEAALAGWAAPKRRTRSGAPVYTDLAIELVLTLRLVFHRLRQAEAFALGVLKLLGLDPRVEDHSHPPQVIEAALDASKPLGFLGSKPCEALPSTSATFNIQTFESWGRPMGSLRLKTMCAAILASGPGAARASDDKHTNAGLLLSAIRTSTHVSSDAAGGMYRGFPAWADRFTGRTFVSDRLVFGS